MKKLLLSMALLTLCIVIHAQSWEINSARNLIENGDYKAAAIRLRPLAESGNAEAQYLAAGLFEQGKGVIKSYEQAEKYYYLSAKQNYEPAIKALAKFYVNERKPDIAFNMLKWACQDNENLMSSDEEGYKDIIIKIVNMFIGNDKRDKAYEALEWACNTNKNYCNNEIGGYRGLILYEGKGITPNKEQGWSLMQNVQKKTKSLELRTEIQKYLNEKHKDFSAFLIDTYTQAGKEEILVSKVLEGIVQEDFSMAWKDEFISLLTGKIATWDAQAQENLLIKLISRKSKNDAEIFLISYMYNKGYNNSGIPNADKAISYAAEVADHLDESCPYMKQETDKILNVFEVGQKFAGVGLGEILKIDGNSVIVALNYYGGTTKMSKAELHKKIAIEKRKEEKYHMTAVSHCPNIIAGKPFCYMRGNTTLRVSIPILLNANSSCMISVSDATYKNTFGETEKAACEIVGNWKNGKHYINPKPKKKENVYVHFEIYTTSNTGELYDLSATLTCGNQTGKIIIEKVVW